jgi:iron-sulfur cluster protein
MQVASNLKEYIESCRESLNDEFLRKTLDNFATGYFGKRKSAFEGIDVEALIREIADAKDEAVARMDELYEQFKARCEEQGVQVHFAATSGQCNEIVAKIARENGVKKAVKSKSMTAEETLLNHHLEAEGLEVAETDLGEWIIQLREEGPSHMVMPAIHLSRDQVSELFTEVTGKSQTNDIESLVKVARRELRRRFIEADMGVTGANFAVAESGAIGLVTNEGNARLVTTLPRVQVHIIGLDKLTPTLHDALRILKILPKNATGQAISSYVTWISGATENTSVKDGKNRRHVIVLDNGRSALAKDPEFSQVLRCVRCGACANVCPAYRMVGGHKYGHIYIGAIGLVLTYFFHGRDKARNLVRNCLNCEACKNVCAAGIDLPRLIKDVHTRIQDEEGHPLRSRMIGQILKNRKLFHSMLRTARALQRPVTGGTPYLRHLPHMLFKQHDYKALPAIAKKPFRDRWKEQRPKVEKPRLKVALFSGCVQDFVYPEQPEAAMKILESERVDVDFPMGQTCCGLPALMMGEKNAAVDVARQNAVAVDPGRYDYILVMCASCGAHMKKQYPRLLTEEGPFKVKAELFADKVMDITTFMTDVLEMKPERFEDKGAKTTYHFPCHLCRGMGITESPKTLMKNAGLDYEELPEEDVCCGFGGSYSMKFPEISAEIMGKKLDNIESTGAEQILTDCPGCILQIRGGMEKRGSKVKVRHTTEAILDQLKKK